MILLALLAGAAARTSSAAQPAHQAVSATPSAAKPASAGTFDNVFTLGDIGVTDTIVLRGTDAYHSVYFSVPRNDLVKTATMKLRFHFSPGLLPEVSHLKISLNGTLFAALPVTTGSNLNAQPGDLTPEEKLAARHTLSVTRSGEENALLEATLAMPAEMLVPDNELKFEFIGHYTMQCEDEPRRCKFDD
jgi:cellulose synthase (UDP-forming)